MPKLGEFTIIERYFTRPTGDKRIIAGIGDDAAIVAAAGSIAVAVDTLVAGTHFPPGLPARAVGHRALAVNLSDLAAVGAKPSWATLALSLPEAEADWLADFAAGFFGLAERFGVALIGGDTTRGPLSITVQLIGDAAERPLLRSGGRPGDRVFVSGTLGDSAAGLELFEARARGASAPADRSEPANRQSEPAGQSEPADVLVDRFGYPQPRVELGVSLVGIAHAAIDVSDGLVADLGHLCRQSGCGAEIDLDALPLSPALTALYPRNRAERLALSGGDDYELCFTCADDDAARIRAAAAKAGTTITEIGRLTDAGGVVGRRGESVAPLAASGFAHF